MAIKELPTEKTKPVDDPAKLRWLFYSEPKTGKTTLAAGFNDPIFLITERSTESIAAYAVPIKSWEDFRDVVELLIRGNHKFKTAVVDVVDVLYRYCIEFCCKRLNIVHQSDIGFAKGYHSVDNEFEHWLNKLEMSGIGLIFTSHLAEKEVNTGKSTFTKIIPGLQPRGRTILEPKVSVIGHLRWEKLKKEGTVKLEYDNKLVIQFKQTAELLVGDRTGRLPDKLILHTIPDNTPTTEMPRLIEEYGKKNYELIASYFK